MSTTRITIITPVFNQAAFLTKALESVARQNDPDCEHIVVDGGSTDGTVEILRAAKGIRWISEPDKGQADAVNKGLAMATGDIVGEINGDDYFLPGAFAKLREAMASHPDAKVFLGGCDTYCEDKLQARWQFNADKITLADVQNHLRRPLPHPSLFIKRDLFLAVGGMNPEIRYAPDVELMLKLAERTDFIVVNAILAANVRHENAIQVKEEIHNWTGCLYQIARHAPYAKFHELFLFARDAAPDDSPILPAFVRALVRERWSALPQRVPPIKRIAVFGAGSHSVWLEGICKDLPGPEVVAVLDENPSCCVQNLWGCKPVHPRDFNPGEVDAIVISTDTYAEAVKGKCAQYFPSGANVLDLYEGLPKGPYRK